MAKKITVSISVTYSFRGKLLKEYLAWLDDYPDTLKMRKWFVVDRFIDHDFGSTESIPQLLKRKNMDPAAKLTVKEIN